MYYAGAQTGATQTGLGTWAGTFDTNRALIGASNKTPIAVWDGWIDEVALFDYALSPDEMADLDVT